MIITTKFFWDCECPTNYINPRGIPECKLCGATKDNQPDSMLEELSPNSLAVINKYAEKYLEEHPDG